MSTPTLFGMRLHISHHLPKTLVHRRPHKQPRWDVRGAYHRRIQKKWDKRHGTYEKDQVVVVAGNVFVSPAAYARIVKYAESTPRPFL